eukprot:3359276-Prymnesium_polylepis.1
MDCGSRGASVAVGHVVSLTVVTWPPLLLSRGASLSVGHVPPYRCHVPPLLLSRGLPYCCHVWPPS